MHEPDDAIEIECPTCGALCTHEDDEYIPSERDEGIDASKVRHLLEKAESAARYTLGTLPYPSSVLKNIVETTSDEWVAVHRGRAASAYNQLQDLVKEVEALKEELSL